MKLLIGAILLISSSAFAYEMSAREAFLSILSPGQYFGNECSVKIEDLGSKVVITAKNQEYVKQAEISDSDTYHRRGVQFLSSKFTRINRNLRIENFIRTVPSTVSTQYIAVGDIWHSTSRDNLEEVVECVVEL
ncbi:MAG: hypothetical protein ACLGHN_00425 [Bacteriovoracia bacterium]